MKNQSFLFLFTVLLACMACKKQEPPQGSTEFIDEQGVIVQKGHLWKVPKKWENATKIVYCSICPYWQFEDKVIVDTHEGNIPGIRCLKVETGEILWEQYFMGPEKPNGFDRIILLDQLFNYNEGYVILSLGFWGDKEHIKVNIHTGDIIWRVPLESATSIMPYGDYYYCTLTNDKYYSAIYKVDVETGKEEFVYASELPLLSSQPFNRVYGMPFEYKGREALLISHMQFTSETTANFYYSLIYADTKETIIEPTRIDDFIDKIEVFDNMALLITGKGYKVFNLETHAIERHVQVINRGDYHFHAFHNDMLILALSGDDGESMNGIHIINPKTHTKVYDIEDGIESISILDGILYYADGKELMGYEFETGKLLLKTQITKGECKVGVASYKNEEGKKFVVVGDYTNTICYEGL